MKLLSFDVEEWFHHLNYDHGYPDVNWDLYPARLETEMGKILALLNCRNIKATFFCLGWVAEKYPGLIKRINEEGHQIGTHSFMHQKIQDLTCKEFATDLYRSVSCLEQLIGKKIICYRAPGFSIDTSNLYVFEVLINNGIEIDSSIVFTNTHKYGGLNIAGMAEPFIINVNGCRIKEFPIPTKRVFSKRLIYSGGGYFRMLPYRKVRSWTAASTYVMTYFHTRDFDCEQPILPNLRRIEKFIMTFGKAGALNKFKLYLHQFPFTNIAAMDKATDWATQKIIDVHSLSTPASYTRRNRT